MAFVRVEQRNAHLAGAVRLYTVEGREGPVSKATLTAISNVRRSGRGAADSRDNRGEESTAIQWTLWGKQAENAAQYLGKGSHINVVGRVQNNNYEKDGGTVYTLAFTAEEIEYLDSRAEGEALRAREGVGAGAGNGAQAGVGADAGGGTAEKANANPAEGARSARGRKSAAKAAADEATDSIPF